MSMYVQLLVAAFEQRCRAAELERRRVALHEVRQCRNELDAGAVPDAEPDRLPVTLARQIGYDIALVNLAQQFGIETDLLRFAQPGPERGRLEVALGHRGNDIDDAPPSSAPRGP
jgi:hypothetical protein